MPINLHGQRENCYVVERVNGKLEVIPFEIVSLSGGGGMNGAARIMDTRTKKTRIVRQGEVYKTAQDAVVAHAQATLANARVKKLDYEHASLKWVEAVDLCRDHGVEPKAPEVDPDDSVERERVPEVEAGQRGDGQAAAGGGSDGEGAIESDASDDDTPLVITPRGRKAIKRSERARN